MSAPILHLSYLGGLGGGESSLLAHLGAFDRTRFASHVICGTEGAFVEELKAIHIPVQVMPFALPYFKYGWMPTATPSFFPRLWHYLRDEKIRLIHCNDPESAYYAAPLAKLLGIPMVWTSWAWWQAERGWKSSFYEKFLTRIITPTVYIKRCLAEANPRLAAMTTVLPFGVNTDAFTPRVGERTVPEPGIPAGARVVTVLARFQSVKGHATLLDAAPMILDAAPDTRFWFVGDATFETDDANATRRTIHERVAADPRLREAVCFSGFRRDIPNVLHASDVLVCPSWFETYGMANLEAMACGVPVVSTNVGGPSETVVDGETGFLVTPKEPQALAERVVTLLRDPALRQRMGENGRRRVLAHYTLKESAAQMQTILMEAMGGR